MTWRGRPTEPSTFPRGPGATTSVAAVACVNYGHDMSPAYSRGYRLAADLLVDKLRSTGSHQDSLVYPIAFLYRQHMELLLKAVIARGTFLLEERRIRVTGHDLVKLWVDAREVMERVWPDGGDEAGALLDGIAAVISEFHDVDRGSDGFRYATGIDGTRSLGRLTHVDLDLLSKRVGSAADLLDGAWTGIEEFISYQLDALANERG